MDGIAVASTVLALAMRALRRAVKCVVTEVVLFSVVAFKTLDISQGGVATHELGVWWDL